MDTHGYPSFAYSLKGSVGKGLPPWMKWLDIAQPQFLWLSIIYVWETEWYKIHKEERRFSGCFWGHTHTLLVFWGTWFMHPLSIKHCLRTPNLGFPWHLLKCRAYWVGGAQQVKCLLEKHKDLSLGPQMWWCISLTSVWGQAEMSRSQWIAG